MSDLLRELEKERKNIKTDSYSMSIGEIINLYKDGDIKLDPAFQRLFRWTDEQKTKFIESILLGIPTPEIFVAQKGDGKWTVVDGVQRISTILQLVGDLKGKDPLQMTYARYLPSLENLTWPKLPEEAQRLFKRGKFGINIILTENSVEAQYELFQRLNTGGLHLEDQEIRNCLIIMINESFYEKLNQAKDYKPFLNCLQLTERKYEAEYHMELMLRYFIAIQDNVNFDEYSNTHMSEFLDKETINLIRNQEFDIDGSIDNFKEIFGWLDELLGKEAFKRYYPEKDNFEGQFSAAAFEAIATGVSIHFDHAKTITPKDFRQKIQDLYQNPDYIEHTKHGVRSLHRFKNLTQFSKNYFAP